jgi:hypothetical protein
MEINKYTPKTFDKWASWRLSAYNEKQQVFDRETLEYTVCDSASGTNIMTEDKRLFSIYFETKFIKANDLKL